MRASTSPGRLSIVGGDWAQGAAKAWRAGRSRGGGEVEELSGKEPSMLSRLMLRPHAAPWRPWPDLLLHLPLPLVCGCAVQRGQMMWLLPDPELLRDSSAWHRLVLQVLHLRRQAGRSAPPWEAGRRRWTGTSRMQQTIGTAVSGECGRGGWLAALATATCAWLALQAAWLHGFCVARDSAGTAASASASAAAAAAAAAASLELRIQPGPQVGLDAVEHVAGQHAAVHLLPQRLGRRQRSGVLLVGGRRRHRHRHRLRVGHAAVAAVKKKYDPDWNRTSNLQIWSLLLYH